MKKWYRIVGFGSCQTPAAVSQEYDKTKQALRRACRKATDGGWTEANTRIYAYRTREQARNGCISDSIGYNGRVSVHDDCWYLAS